MDKLRDILEREPVAFVAAITAVVEAAIALLPLFGIPLTVEQMAGIMSLVAALGGVTIVIYARPKVTPIAAPALAKGIRARLTVDPQALGDYLQGLSMDEARTIAREIGINPDNVPGETINLYGLELVAYAERHGKLDALGEVAAGF